MFDFLAVIFANVAPYTGFLALGAFIGLALIIVVALVWRILPILREWSE